MYSDVEDVEEVLMYDLASNSDNYVRRLAFC